MAVKILSLGAGVQSSTALLMSCHGELPKLDAAVFADTHWEPAEVYTWLKELTEISEKAGIPVFTVSTGDLRADALRSSIGAQQEGEVRAASMPLYVTQPGESKAGMIRRQCTREYKIDPIRREIRRVIGVAPRGRVGPGTVDLWMGISSDEASRMRPSQVQWITHIYPLIDQDPPMRRSDCNMWLKRHGYVNVPRSACIGCPFHSNAEWEEIKKNPVEWADAVEFDEAIRDRDVRGGSAFLHRSVTPLKEAVMDDGSLRLWDDECTGYCGV